MSDEHVMGSADAAAAADASKRVQTLIEETWECVDGPPCACFTYRRVQGHDEREDYVAWAFAPRSSYLLGHRSLDALIDWLPDGFLQYADRLTEERRPPLALREQPAITPATHRIVWRSRPEFQKRDDSRWYLYCRMAFMPKDAWILDVEET